MLKPINCNKLINIHKFHTCFFSHCDISKTNCASRIIILFIIQINPQLLFLFILMAQNKRRVEKKMISMMLSNETPMNTPSKPPQAATTSLKLYTSFRFIIFACILINPTSTLESPKLKRNKNLTQFSCFTFNHDHHFYFSSISVGIFIIS